jgi:aminoglycoside phosphotransferase (APT) family kinase protein
MMPNMNLDAWLPAELRGPTTKLAVGQSGAGVYRIDAPSGPLVLKVSSELAGEWRRKLATVRAAAEAGVAPAVVHADEEHRAIVSAFVADRSFFALYATARDAALDKLATTLRKVHALPVVGEPRDPRALLGDLSIVPASLVDVVARVRDEVWPTEQLVLSHNDVNPTNLIYDGERVLLLDWDVAAPNDPAYDFAAAAVFFRMDDATCARLVTPTPRFRYYARLVAVTCGVVFLRLAGGGPDDKVALADVSQRLRTGALDVNTAAGRWQFGLALIGEAHRFA